MFVEETLIYDHNGCKINKNCDCWPVSSLIVRSQMIIINWSSQVCEMPTILFKSFLSFFGCFFTLLSIIFLQCSKLIARVGCPCIGFESSSRFWGSLHLLAFLSFVVFVCIFMLLSTIFCSSRFWESLHFLVSSLALPCQPTVSVTCRSFMSFKDSPFLQQFNYRLTNSWLKFLSDYEEPTHWHSCIAMAWMCCFMIFCSFCICRFSRSLHANMDMTLNANLNKAKIVY